MKKFLFAAFIALLPAILLAGHRRYFRSADDITSGTLGPDRLPSGVMFQGAGVVSSSNTTGMLENANVLRSSHTNSGAAGNLVQNNPGVIVDTMTAGLLQNANVLRSSHTNSGAAGNLVQNNAGVIVGTMTAGLMANDGPVLRASHTISGASGGLVQTNPHVIVSSMIAPGHSGQTWLNEGSALSGGMVTSVDCTGDGVTCSQSGSSITLNVPGGGGGSSTGNSTFTIRLGGSGEIVISTAPLFAARSLSMVQKSTINVIDVHGYAAPKSTYAASMFRVFIGTSIESMIPHTQHVVVSTDTDFSVTFTTGFRIPAGNFYAVEVATCPDKGGRMPQVWGVNLRAWREPEPYP